MNKNFYDILGVSRTATKKEISDAYRKLVMKHHPDKFKEEKERKIAEKTISEINEAFNVLGNESKRQDYDNHLRYGSNYSGNNFDNYRSNPQDGDSFFQQFNFGFGDINNIFKQFFDVEGEDNFHQTTNNAPSRRTSIVLNFFEWYNGVDKTIKLKRKVQCLTCQKKSIKCQNCNGKGRIHSSIINFGANVCTVCLGRGEINKRISCVMCSDGTREEESSLKFSIPRFANNKIILNGYGDYHPKINKIGNLEINISLSSDDNYYIDDSSHIFINLNIGVEEFLTGCNISFKFLDGSNISLEIPPLSTDSIIIKNKGIKSGNRFGHLIINVKIQNNIKDKINKQAILQKLNIEPIKSNFFIRKI